MSMTCVKGSMLNYHSCSHYLVPVDRTDHCRSVWAECTWCAAFRQSAQWVLLLDGRNCFFDIWKTECRVPERSLSPHEHFLHRTVDCHWPVHLLCDLCTKKCMSAT